jgi:alpha-L-fucosidase
MNEMILSETNRMSELPPEPKRRRFRKRFVLYCLLLAGIPVLHWWLNLPEPVPDAEYIYGPPENLEWFREAKFGVMIHWGPVSLTGEELSWSRRASRPGQDDAESPVLDGGRTVPVDTYDRLYESFNPTLFDADAWMDLFRRAGAGYIVFVTKHHDGFCMFDSRLTEYKITNSPYGRDITAEIADACRRAGLKLGFYYSQPDWRHPDYRARTHERYIPYLHGHVHELCLGYGPVDLFWFDGLNWRVQDWDSVNLFRMIRHLQPQAIINNRSALAGDFDVYEQEVGYIETVRAWETCMTMGSQWSYKPGDQLKPASELIGTLLRVAGSGGNFLLNVGPRPDGTIDPPQAERLEQIGEWLGRYGESVHATRAGPFRPKGWGVATHRENRVYLHVLDDESTRLDLPDIGRNIRQAELITGGSVKTTRSGGRIWVELSPLPSLPPPWTVRLELDGRSPDMLPAPD